MKAPKTLIPLVLFAAAFAGSLFVLRRAESPGAVASMRAAESRGVLRSLAGAREAARSLGVAAGIRGARTDGKQRSLDAARDARNSARLRFAPATSTAIAVAGARPGEPASSIASPDSQSRPESRDALSSSADIAQALDALSYGAPDDRVRAIQSLAATDPDAPELARVRSSLRLAAADEDPDIAARAQEAYDSLMKREDP